MRTHEIEEVNDVYTDTYGNIMMDAAGTDGKHYEVVVKPFDQIISGKITYNEYFDAYVFVE